MYISKLCMGIIREMFIILSFYIVYRLNNKLRFALDECMPATVVASMYCIDYNSTRATLTKSLRCCEIIHFV